MAHITVYLPNTIESRIRKVAKRRKMTVNKWIADEIDKAVRDTLPDSFLQAAGSVPDFPDLAQIRSSHGKDSPRKAL